MTHCITRRGFLQLGGAVSLAACASRREMIQLLGS